MAKILEIRVTDVGQISHPLILDFSGLTVKVGDAFFVLSGRMENFMIRLGEKCEAEMRCYLYELGKNEPEVNAEVRRVRRAVKVAIQDRYK